MKTGELLFSASEEERIKFQLDTLHRYKDTKHLRQIQYFYLKKRIKQAIRILQCKMTQKERFEKLYEFIDKWAEEINENGIERLEVVYQMKL